MSENTEVEIEDQELQLEPNNVLKFDVENRGETVVLELKSGLAEIFGTELVKGKSYTFSFGAQIVIFTWKGCILKLRGRKGIGSIFKDTPMSLYSNFHSSLEQLRVESEKRNKPGPVTMIVGPNDVGKSTLCRILLNYSMRTTSVVRRPIYVDLDPKKGLISIASTIGAVMVEKPVEIEDNFITSDKLIYHFGHLAINSDSTLYSDLITYMGNVVLQRMLDNPRIIHSGLIINTCGWVTGEGFEHLIHIAHAFQVNVILVLDDGHLCNELKRNLPVFVKIIQLPKFSGVIKSSRKLKSERKEARIREYFYGTPRYVKQPHICEVKFSDLRVYRIVAQPVPQVVMPLPVHLANVVTKQVPVAPGPNMMHHILSVSWCTSTEETIDKLYFSAGFVCVINVDTSRKIITLLSPHRTLLKTIYFMSDVQFMNRNA